MAISNDLLIRVRKVGSGWQVTAQGGRVTYPTKASVIRAVAEILKMEIGSDTTETLEV